MPNGYKYADITEKIIGCAMRVHSKLKNGHREIVYQRCLAIELRLAEIEFVQEADMPVYYEGIVVSKRRIDFLVAQIISVELKACSDLQPAHMAQAINNLETHRLEIGLLLNFGAKSLQFKRIINNHKLNQNS